MTSFALRQESCVNIAFIVSCKCSRVSITYDSGVWAKTQSEAQVAQPSRNWHAVRGEGKTATGRIENRHRYEAWFLRSGGSENVPLLYDRYRLWDNFFPLPCRCSAKKYSGELGSTKG